MVIKTCFHIINSDPCLQPLVFLLKLMDVFLTSFEGSGCFSIDFIRTDISSRMFNGVWVHAVLILLYFWCPRYSSFPDFPSPLDLTHSDTITLTQAALRPLSCLCSWRGCPRTGHDTGPPLCTLAQQVYFLQADLFNLATPNKASFSEDMLYLKRTYFGEEKSYATKKPMKDAQSMFLNEKHQQIWISL